MCTYIKCRSNLSHSLKDYLVADRDLIGVVVTDRDLRALITSSKKAKSNFQGMIFRLQILIYCIRAILKVFIKKLIFLQ